MDPFFDFQRRINSIFRDFANTAGFPSISTIDPFMDVDMFSDILPVPSVPLLSNEGTNETGKSQGQFGQTGQQQQSQDLTTQSQGGQQLSKGGSRSNWHRFGVPRVNLDIVAEKDKYILQADVPGLKKEDINLSVKDGIVTISGEKKEEQEEKKEDKERGVQYIRRERTIGSFNRSIRLPPDAAAENIDAKYENGVLKVIIPRKTQQEDKGNVQIQ